MNDLLTTSAVAKLLGVTPQTIRLWIRKGALTYVEVGPTHLRRQRRTLRVPRSEVEKTLALKQAI